MESDVPTVSGTRSVFSEKRVDTVISKAQSPVVLMRFLAGPVDCEIIDLCESSDGRAMFINIQHPGEGAKMADLGNPAKYASQ